MNPQKHLKLYIMQKKMKDGWLKGQTSYFLEF